MFNKIGSFMLNQFFELASRHRKIGASQSELLAARSFYMDRYELLKELVDLSDRPSIPLMKQYYESKLVMDWFNICIPQSDDDEDRHCRGDL